MRGKGREGTNKKFLFVQYVLFSTLDDASIDINSMQITKSVNGEPSEKDKKVQTPWGPGIWLILGYTR